MSNRFAGRTPLKAEQRELLEKATARMFSFLGPGKPLEVLPVEKARSESVIPGEPDRGERVSPQQVSVGNIGDALDEILRRLSEQAKVPVTEPAFDFKRALSAMKARAALGDPRSQRGLRMVEFYGKKLLEAVASRQAADAEIRRQVAAVKSRL